MTLNSSTATKGLFHAKRNGNSTWLAAKMQKAVTNWLNENAPGQPRAAALDTPQP